MLSHLKKSNHKSNLRKVTRCSHMCVCAEAEGCFNLAPAGWTRGDRAANTNTLLSPTNRPGQPSLRWGSHHRITQTQIQIKTQHTNQNTYIPIDKYKSAAEEKSTIIQHCMISTSTNTNTNTNSRRRKNRWILEHCMIAV